MVIGLIVVVVMVVVVLWNWKLLLVLVIKLAQCLDMLKNPPVFLTVFLILYTLTFCSIAHSVAGDIYKHLYDVLRVFTLSANDFHLDTLKWADDWGLLIMVWVDAFFMVTAFLSLATESLVRWVLAKGIPNKHIIIFGLGAWGLHYAKTLSGSGIDVVVVEKEPRDAAVREVVETWSQASKRHRIHLVIGDCLDETVLKKAKFENAGKILPMLKDDGENINAAYFVRGLKSGDEQVILLPVDDIRLSTSLATYKRFIDHHSTTEIRFFNIMQQAAIRHFSDHPPELYAHIFGHENVHFSIYGLGDFAINLIYVIAHIAHFRTWNLDDTENIQSIRVRVTIYDQKPKCDVLADLTGIFPNLDKIIDLHYQSTEALRIEFENVVKQEPPVTQHIFCFSNEVLSVRYATRLRRQQVLAKKANAPIFVRSFDGKGLSRLIESNCDKEEWPDNIFPLVLLSDKLGQYDYFSESIGKIARAFNDYQTPSDKKGELEQKGEAERWKYIPSDFKHSSLYQAFYLSTRLRSIGYEWRDKDENEKTKSSCVKWSGQEKIHSHIAHLEHDRWKSERWLLGWTSEGDRTLGDIARIHGELEAKDSNKKWNSAYDIQQAKYLPKYLDKADCRLVKLNTIGFIKPESANLSEINTDDVLIFNLLDKKALDAVEKRLENHHNPERILALLPLPFEILKELLPALEKTINDKSDLDKGNHCPAITSIISPEYDVDQQKLDFSAADIFKDMSKMAGEVGTYIEMPLERPFTDWKRGASANEQQEWLCAACAAVDQYIASRSNKIYGNQNFQIESVCTLYLPTNGIRGNNLQLSDTNASSVQKKAIPVEVVLVESGGTCATKEGDVAYQPGDAVLTGVEGEKWPIARSKFNATYEPVAPTKAGENGTYVKRPIKVYALQMNEPFYIDVCWGAGRLDGKPGDWLIQYGPSDYGVVSQSIFRETYDFVGG